MSSSLTWRFPHQGPPSSSDCGTLRWVGHEVGETWHAWQTARDCGERDCGTCRSVKRADGTWITRGWERREGRAIGALCARWAASPPRGFEDQPFVHVIISPPPESFELWGSPEGYRAQRDLAVDLARDVGVRDAVMVVHPWRVHGELRDGPHWHLIARARVVDNDGKTVHAWVDGGRVAQLHALTGWVIKNAGIVEKPSGLAGYLLSHAGIACGCADNGATQVAPLSVYPRGPGGGAPGILLCVNTSHGRSPVQTVTVWGYGADVGAELVDPGPDAVTCPRCKQQIPAHEVVTLEWFGSAPDPPPPGEGITVEKSRARRARTLSEEWEDWRRNRDIYEITGGVAGRRDPMPARE